MKIAGCMVCSSVYLAEVLTLITCSIRMCARVQPPVRLFITHRVMLPKKSINYLHALALRFPIVLLLFFFLQRSGRCSPCNPPPSPLAKTSSAIGCVAFCPNRCAWINNNPVVSSSWWFLISAPEDSSPLYTYQNLSLPIYYSAQSIKTLDSKIKRQKPSPSRNNLPIMCNPGTSLWAVFTGTTFHLKRGPNENCSRYNLWIRTLYLERHAAGEFSFLNVIFQCRVHLFSFNLEGGSRSLVCLSCKACPYTNRSSFW